jgi:hypothetical protein
MSKELREAAKQMIVNLDAGGIDGAHDRLTRIIVNGAALAKAYLAEHPADDEEPVTPDMMLEWGFGDSIYYRSEKRFEICDSVRVMFEACEGPKCWKASVWIGRYTTIDNPTCGDVRRLARALGVTLKETT